MVSARKIKDSSKQIEKEANTLLDTVTKLNKDTTDYENRIDSKIQNSRDIITKYEWQITNLLIGLAVGSVLIFVIVELLFGISIGLVYSVILTFILFFIFLYVIYKRIPVVPLPSKSEESLTLINRSIESSKIVAGGAVSIVKKLVPQIDAFLSEAEKQKRWESFSESLQNATKLYGFKTVGIIRGWSIWSDNPNTWLDESATKLSQSLSVSKSIIMLSYYDYVDEIGNCKNTWAEIKTDKVILNELILYLLKNKYVDILGKEIINYKTNVPAIVRSISDNDTFSLEEFNILIYSIYKDLLKQKLKILEKLKILQFPFINDEDFVNDVLTFMPKNKEREAWKTDIIDFIAEKTKIESNLLQLFILPDNELLETIKADEKSSLLLIDILINNHLVAVPTNYNGNSNVSSQLLNIIKGLPTFNLVILSNDFTERLNEIETTKRLFLKVINDYKLPILDKKSDFSKFFPESDPAEGTAIYLSELCGMDKNILLLLYFEYSNNQTKTRFLFDNIIKDPIQTKNLAEAILTTGTITVPENLNKSIVTESISAMLKVQNKFNIQSLALDIPKFNEFLKYSDSLIDFLFNEGFSKIRIDVPINRLAEMFQTNGTSEQTYQKLKELCEYILKQAKSISYLEDVKKQLIVAILSIYLTTKKADINSRHACQEAEKFDMANKILYQYIYLKEKGREDKNKNIKLIKIVDGVVNAEYSDYIHLEAFKSELSNGRLPIAISLLLSNKFDSLAQQIDKIEDTFNQNFDNIKDRIREFLRSKLNKVNIDQSLESKIFSAYLISSSEGKALGLLDKYLSEALNELDGTSKTYSKKILLSTEEKTVAGKGTRVGVIPPNQNFDQIMTLLDKVFDKIVKLSGESNPVAYTIVKIDPSQTTFKHLSFNTTAGFDPSDIIKNLIIEKFNPLLNMSLVAINSNNPSEKVVMVDIIKEFFNTQTTIYVLLESSISISNKGALNYLKSGKLDNALFNKYVVSSLCDFSYKIYGLNKSLGDKKVKDELSANILKLLEDEQLTIDKNEAENLAALIFTKVENIATIIQMG